MHDKLERFDRCGHNAWHRITRYLEWHEDQWAAGSAVITALCAIMLLTDLVPLYFKIGIAVVAAPIWVVVAKGDVYFILITVFTLADTLKSVNKSISKFAIVVQTTKIISSAAAITGQIVKIPFTTFYSAVHGLYRVLASLYARGFGFLVYYYKTSWCE